jgi:TonB family protein
MAISLVASISFSACSSWAQVIPAATEGEWVSRLRKKVERSKIYPPSMLERYESGQVRVRFAVDPSGRLISSSIVKPSCYDNLNAAALDTIKRAAPFHPFPPSMPRKKKEFMIELVYYSGIPPAGAPVSQPRRACLTS